MKTKLLTIGTPTLNGNLYDKEALDKAIASYKAEFIPLYPIMDSKQSIENIIGVVENLQTTENELLGDIKLMDNYKNLFFEGVSVRPSFIGQVDENGIVSDIEIISFSLTQDPA